MSSQDKDQQRKQKRLGPAPIASFEEPLDEMDSSPESRLPEIREHQTITTAADNKTSKGTSSDASTSSTILSKNPPIGMIPNFGLNTPSTPRIDISRASSSSHHEDSRDSSPENVFEQVGTGTLQECSKSRIGFQEDGTLELRSSTEELYFMEKDKEKEKSDEDRFTQQIRRSPIMTKYDEHQGIGHSNQRKDSASSEVAALLCISGRTSRISSVGSQGSAVSRLSAVSGISRSPSPHKMLLETSFCGPKPLDNNATGGILNSIEPQTVDVLEQMLLGRKHDPTQAVLAEGIHIDMSTPKKVKKESKNVSNGSIVERQRKKSIELKTDEITVDKPQYNLSKSRGSITSKSSSKSIIGVTSSGVEYIRIRLKPDHLYGDDDIGANERVVDEVPDSIKKPATLRLGQDAPSKKAAPHFSQLVQGEDEITKCSQSKLTPNSSPKPGRHLLRDVASRSPSPATVGVSRKNSFCSLFKLKDAVASPESPTVSGQRKKSAGISVLLGDSPRDRSRSKSRERERGPSQNSTPSKQKSVLAIFKPKRSGSKSKSSSPVDPEAMSTLDSSTYKHSSEQKHSTPTSRQTPKLKYYEDPPDCKGIHIPLHTPPDEKENIELCTVSVIKERRQQSEPKTTPVAAVSSGVLNQKPTTLRTTTTKSSAPTEKVYRIENADGSVRIPLRSPSSNDLIENDSIWSLEVQRNSSMESQETVISNQTVQTENSNTRKPSTPSLPFVPSSDQQPGQSRRSLSRTPSDATSPKPVQDITPPTTHPPSMSTTTSTTAIPTAITAPTTSSNKKRILFSTKLGSGSQEQLFATQLSLSKTESLSSQLSEQISTLDSPAIEKDGIILLPKCDPVASRRAEESTPTAVILRSKEQTEDQKRSRSRVSRDQQESSDSLRNSVECSSNINRHSRYIENIDEIMKTQKQLELEKRLAKRDSIKEQTPPSTSEEKCIQISQNKKPEPVLQIPGPPPISATASFLQSEEAHCSSESERGSDIHLSHHQHLTHQIGAVEEESTGLVAQESFEDELPYVPTTLPEERALGVSLIPIKERSFMDVKTIPVERPRSTTPINPSYLEEYCGIVGSGDNTDSLPNRGEKLKISLPRKESKEKCSKSAKSPRRISTTSGKSWFEFAEQGIGPTASPTSGPDRRNSNSEEDPPPPLPPRKPQVVTQWINFENIPEKRKPPKRITTLPNKESSLDRSAQVQYNYVNPEECQCECHEIERDSNNRTSSVESSESSRKTVEKGKHGICSKKNMSKSEKSRESFSKSDSIRQESSDSADYENIRHGDSLDRSSSQESQSIDRVISKESNEKTDYRKT